MVRGCTEVSHLWLRAIWLYGILRSFTTDAIWLYGILKYLIYSCSLSGCMSSCVLLMAACCLVLRYTEISHLDLHAIRLCGMVRYLISDCMLFGCKLYWGFLYYMLSSCRYTEVSHLWMHVVWRSCSSPVELDKTWKPWDRAGSLEQIWWACAADPDQIKPHGHRDILTIHKEYHIHSEAFQYFCKVKHTKEKGNISRWSFKGKYSVADPDSLKSWSEISLA